MTRNLSIARILLPIVVALSGCAPGFQTFSSRALKPPVTPEDLQSISLAYTSADDECTRTLKLPLERTLRERYRLFKVHALPKGQAVGDDSFLLEMSWKQNGTAWPVMVSIFTLGAIPSTWRVKNEFHFNLRAPNGNTKTFKYIYTERTYAWLPFWLFGARFYISAFGGDSNEYSAERDQLLSQISTNLIDDATPFLISNSRQNK